MEREWLCWRDWASRWFRRRLVDRHLVDELAQEACLQAWRSRCVGRVREVSLPWVVGISSNLLGAHFRREYARWLPRGAEPLEEIADQSRQRMVRIGLRCYPLTRLLVLLETCLDELPLVSAALQRDRLAGLTMAEIAARHGFTVSVVKLRLFRVRQRLKQAILQRLHEEDEDDDVVSCVG